MIELSRIARLAWATIAFLISRKSEFFYDPFVAGDRAEHANRFYEILRGLPHVHYFLSLEYRRGE